MEGFTCMIIFKNIFSFALTFKAYDWLIENHTDATPLFNAVGTVQVVVSLTTIPLCKFVGAAMQIWSRGEILTSWTVDIYGKRLRSYFARHDILAAFGVR